MAAADKGHECKEDDGEDKTVNWSDGQSRPPLENVFFPLCISHLELPSQKLTANYKRPRNIRMITMSSTSPRPPLGP